MTTPTPDDAARAHCLQELAVFADRLAVTREQAQASVTNPADLDYLRTYARTARSIADRLRASPGYRLEGS